MSTEVKTKWVGDADQAIKEIEKLQKAVVKLQSAQVANTNASKKAARESQLAITEQIHGVGKMVAGLFTIEKAVDVVRDSYREWKELIKEVGEEADKSATQLVHLISKTGDLLHGREIEAFVKGRNLSPEVFGEAFGAVSNASPSLGRERRLELAEVVARSNVVHGQPDQLGSLVGQIAQIDPGLSAGDTMDVATLLRQKAGARAEELTSRNSIQAAMMLVETQAMTAKEAFGLMATVLQNEGSTKTLDKLAAAIKEPGERVETKRGVKLTPEQLAHNAFIDATPAERYGMVMNDPTVRRAILGNADAARFGRIKDNDVLAAFNEVDQAMRTDLAEREREALLGFGAGRQHLADAQSSGRNKAASRALGESIEVQARQLAQQELDTILKEQHSAGAIGMLGAMSTRWNFMTGQMAADLLPGFYGPGGAGVGENTISEFYVQLLENARRELELMEKQNQLLERNNELQRNRPRPLPNPEAHRE
ncbi:MAG: hypothetical protein JNG90_19485 [Planctomycetaceae bacterium]|nr:hypothetical protein [Planctomycetaceae bacterium]